MKRIFDLIISIVGLIVLSPIFLIVSILIVADSPGGAFFRGERVGRYGKIFRIFKFRSMKPNCEGKGKWNIGDRDDRLTKVGPILRKSKLDELPQLINVLKGDMSLVGPRPELEFYTKMYKENERVILELRPGITDWASITNFEQFKGFTEADDPDVFYLEQVRPLKLRLQLYYYYHHNFIEDVRCILWTIYKVITHSQKLPEDIQKIINEYKQDQLKDRNTIH